MAPSWHAINLAIWTLALLLQLALVIAVVLRGIAGSYRAFTVLIVFYPLRTILLFVLLRRTVPAVGEGWSNGLSVLEIFLEAWLLVELASRLLKGMEKRTASRIGAAMGIAAFVGGMATLAVLPSAVLVDRTQVFFWWAMLAVGCSSILRGRLPDQVSNLSRICRGVAAFSLCQLMALAGRSRAFVEHSRHGYVAWSYVPAIAYMVVVAYWLLFLRKEAPLDRIVARMKDGPART